MKNRGSELYEVVNQRRGSGPFEVEVKMRHAVGLRPRFLFPTSLFVSYLALVSLPLLADAANWPQFGRDAKHHRSAEEFIGLPLTAQWAVAAGGAIVSSPTTAEGMVFFGSRDKKIYAVDAATGALKWSYVTGGWVDASPAVADGVVYVVSRDGFLYALDIFTGSLKWKYATGGTDIASPMVSGGVVYGGAGYPNKFAFAILAQDGTEKWRTSMGQFVYSSPALDGGIVCVGSNDGKWYGLSAESGAIKWSMATKGRIHAASPLIAETTVYGASGEFDREVYAIDLTLGQIRWQQAIADASFNALKVSSPALGQNGVLYIAAGNVGEDIVVSALRADTGQVLWQTKAPGLTSLGVVPNFDTLSSPALTEEYVLVGSGDGQLYALNRATGVMAASYACGGAIVSSPIVSNGWVYVGTLGGTLKAFKATEIVTVSSPDVEKTQTVRSLVVKGVAQTQGFESYSLRYGTGVSPSSWTTLVTNATTSVPTDQTLTVWSIPASVIDGEYTVQLDVKTGGSSKSARSTFFLATILTSSAINAASGGTLTASDGTQVVIPAGGLNQNDTLTIRGPGFFTFAVPDQGIPAGVSATAVSREFTFTKADTVLTKRASVVVPYTDSEVVNRDEERLRLYVWDPAASRWKTIHTSLPLSGSNVVAAEVSHFSMFRVMEFVPSDDLLQEDTVYSYPNPATGNTVTFKFLLGDDSAISINVYNVAGQRIAHLEGSGLGGVASEIAWDTIGIASGTYIYQLEARARRTGKMEMISKKLAIVK